MKYFILCLVSTSLFFSCATLKPKKVHTYKWCLERNWVPEKDVVKEDMLRLSLNRAMLFFELSDEKLAGKLQVKDNCLLMPFPG